MAGLTGGRKEEDGLAIFVLAALQHLAVDDRNVEVQLAARVRVEFHLHGAGACATHFGDFTAKGVAC